VDKDIVTTADAMLSLKGAILNIKWKENSNLNMCSLIERLLDEDI